MVSEELVMTVRTIGRNLKLPARFRNNYSVS